MNRMTAPRTSASIFFGLPRFRGGCDTAACRAVRPTRTDRTIRRISTGR